MVPYEHYNLRRKEYMFTKTKRVPDTTHGYSPEKGQQKIQEFDEASISERSKILENSPRVTIDKAKN